MKPKSIELLAFDSSHVLQYEGKCMLRIDRLSEMLLVEPVNEEYKMISATFKWDFVMDKNILFVFGKHELSDFALVYDKEKLCKKVYNFIVEDQGQNDIGKEILHQRFLHPISNRIFQKDETTSKLKQILVEWIDNHEEKAKEKFLKDFKENDLFDNAASLNTNSENNLRKRSRPQDDSVPGYSGDKELPPTSQKTKFPRKKLSKNFTKAVDQTMFKIVNVKFVTQLRWRLYRRLLIFSNVEKTFCYEFSCGLKMNLFTCIGCKAKGKYLIAILDKDENGNEYIKMEDKEHICSSIQYIPENYIEMKIILKPDYELLEQCNTASGKILIIFDQNDKSQCWEFRFDKSKNLYVCRQCRMLAKVWNESTEDECVELTNAKHGCKFVPYAPKKYYEFNDFVISPDFEFHAVFRNGEEKKRLIILDKNDKKLCYIYSTYQNYFYCIGCKKKGLIVSAKLLQNSEGVDYVLLSTTKHVCELQSYSKNIKKEIILHPPDFEVIDNTENGMKKLFIFKSKDRSLCYTFCQRRRTRHKYYCLGCNNIKIKNYSNNLQCNDEMSAELCKDEKDEYYVRVMGSKHICRPRKYEPEKYTKKEDQRCYNFFFFRRCRYPNSIILAIYHPENKKLCYQLTYNKRHCYFACNGCQYKGKINYVRIKEDENGKEYFNQDYKNHVCEPITVSSICAPTFLILNRRDIDLEKKNIPTQKRVKMRKNKHECELAKNDKNANTKVISSSDFITFSENSDGKITAVIVFTSAARDECYEFTFHKNTKLFRCRGF